MENLKMSNMISALAVYVDLKKQDKWKCDNFMMFLDKLLQFTQGANFATWIMICQ